MNMLLLTGVALAVVIYCFKKVTEPLPERPWVEDEPDPVDVFDKIEGTGALTPPPGPPVVAVWPDYGGGSGGVRMMTVDPNTGETGVVELGGQKESPDSVAIRMAAAERLKAATVRAMENMPPKAEPLADVPVTVSEPPAPVPVLDAAPPKKPQKRAARPRGAKPVHMNGKRQSKP